MRSLLSTPTGAAQPRAQQTFVATNWRRVDPPHNTLIGHVNLYTPAGYLFLNCGVHVRGEKRWISFAGSPQLDKDRRQLLTPGGKLAWSNHVAIPDPERREQFKRAALAAVDKLLGGAP